MTDNSRPVSASRTIMARAMLPSDANPWGNVHGGEIMKLIDSCAGAAAQRHARSKVVTARIDELSFVAPVFVGDLVTAKASVNEVGSTSMEVGVRVEAENTLTGKVVHVASAYLVFVAIDDQGKPAPLPALVTETEEEKRRMAGAKQRRELRKQRPRSGRGQARARLIASAGIPPAPMKVERQGASMNDKTPKNQAGQPPTRSPEETEERLEEKQRGQTGEANKMRTEDQIDEVRTKK